MGTGKTAVGAILAQRLHRRLIDTDSLVEESTGLSIPSLFARFGEAYFRDRESEVIASLGRFPAGTLIVSTGGGALLRESNRELLRQNGVLVLLTASPLAILRRVTKTGERPLLVGPGARQKIIRLLKDRKECYSKYDLKFDTTGRTPQRVARDIIRELGL